MKETWFEDTWKHYKVWVLINLSYVCLCMYVFSFRSS